MHNANHCQKVGLVSIILLVLVLISEANLFASSIVELTAIGRIESVYKDRVSMNVLYIVACNDEKLNVATGSWVSFDILNSVRDKASRRDKAIGYGDVVEVSLIGNVATEYEVDEDEKGDKKISFSDNKSPSVLLWTCQSCKKVKRPKDYLPDTKDDSKKGRKKDKKKAEKGPVKIWTQEETVRGKVLVKGDKVYLKEDRLGKRDKGLEVNNEEWANKLKDMPERRVVLHGVTHRTSAASGTMEIHNILKVYSK